MEITGVASSQCWLARLYDMLGYGRRVGFALYRNDPGIQYVGTVGYITEYVSIGNNLNVLA